MAVVLWLGFYGLGFAVAAALLALPWLQLEYQGEIGYAGGLCALGAVSIAWAMLPRFWKADPPPDPSDPTSYAELARLVRDVASRVRHPEPEQVFLSHDANAFAGRFKRPNGRGRQSVVGVGLPMLEILSREELMSVIAHEMGHHTAGDVLLGPWVYRIRRLIGESLERLEGSSFWLHLPFVAYGNLFLRLTRRTSREQELSADALAARVCGTRATATALGRIHRLGSLWDAYWIHEVVPLLNLGFRPPLVAGFERMLRQPKRRAEIEATVTRLTDQDPSPTDTHPTLEERLQALNEKDEDPPRGDNAISLLADLDAAEIVVVRSVMQDPTKDLKPIAWDDVAEKALLPAWKGFVAELGDALREMSPSVLPATLRSVPTFVERLPAAGIAVWSPAAERRRALRVLSAWLSVHLHEKGFAIVAEPGAEVRLVKGDVVIEPVAVVRDLADGKLSAEDWLTQVTRGGEG